MNIWQFLTADTKLLWAAIVSAVVSALVSYLSKRYELRDKLQAEYEAEQRKRLRELIGRYHGRMLQASLSLEHRLWSIYYNYKEGWLATKGNYRKLGYFHLSTIYRFLNVCTLVRQFELEALYLDARIAAPDDFMFMNYLAALQWALTDLDIFRGLKYSGQNATDHFFVDSLRSYCDSFETETKFITMEQLSERIAKDKSLDPVIGFFDGISRDEERLRWDRLVIFHLLLAAFINAYGYKVHRIDDVQLAKIVGQIRNPQIVSNFLDLDCLARLGFDQSREAKQLRKVCDDFLQRQK